MTAVSTGDGEREPALEGGDAQSKGEGNEKEGEGREGRIKKRKIIMAGGKEWGEIKCVLHRHKMRLREQVGFSLRFSSNAFRSRGESSYRKESVCCVTCMVRRPPFISQQVAPLCKAFTKKDSKV